MFCRSVSLGQPIHDWFWILAVCIEWLKIFNSIDVYLKWQFRVEKFLTLGDDVFAVLRLDLADEDFAKLTRSGRWIKDQMLSPENQCELIRRQLP